MREAHRSALRRLSVFVIPLLLCCSRTTFGQSAGSVCRASILDQDTLMQSYLDAYGHDVEVWCVRDWYKPWDAHYELRISYASESVPDAGIAGGEPGRKVAPQRRTVGGCFFFAGDNDGPDIDEDQSIDKQKYIRVSWTNEDPISGKKYTFIYDWRTNKVKIRTRHEGYTDADNGRYHAPYTEEKEVDAPASYDELKKLLPDPDINGCTLRTEPAALGFTDLPDWLRLKVRDSLTGIAISWVDAHVENASKGWALTVPTESDGSAIFRLGPGEYEVFADYKLLWTRVSSRHVRVQIDRGRDLNLSVVTFGLPGHAMAFLLPVIVVAILLTITLASRGRRQRPRSAPPASGS